MRSLIIFTLLVHSGIFAQTEHFWALPAADAPVSMHATADTGSAIVARLTSDNVLLVHCEGRLWCAAQDHQGRQGFVLQERITALTALPDSSAVPWMLRIFQRQQQLGEGITAMHLVDLAAQQAYGDSLNQQDMVHHAALALFLPTYCRTVDATLLLGLMRAVAANPGSASEEPPTKLAMAYQCQPQAFKAALRSLPVTERAIVLDASSTGLMLSFDEQDSAAVAQRDRLIAELNEP